jgi:hypothetical protein
LAPTDSPDQAGNTHFLDVPFLYWNLCLPHVSAHLSHPPVLHPTYLVADGILLIPPAASCSSSTTGLCLALSLSHHTYLPVPFAILESLAPPQKQTYNVPQPPELPDSILHLHSCKLEILNPVPPLTLLVPHDFPVTPAQTESLSSEKGGASPLATHPLSSSLVSLTVVLEPLGLVGCPTLKGRITVSDTHMTVSVRP